MSFVASRLPIPISSPRHSACPPSRKKPDSNDTRVRVDGFVKIIDIVCPANGLYEWPASPLRIGLIFFASSSTSRSSDGDRSFTCRKWRPPPASRIAPSSVPDAKIAARDRRVGADARNDDGAYDDEKARRESMWESSREVHKRRQRANLG